MIAREFQDTIPGVQDKITKLAQILGKEYRVFNSSDNFNGVSQDIGTILLLITLPLSMILTDCL